MEASPHRAFLRSKTQPPAFTILELSGDLQPIVFSVRKTALSISCCVIWFHTEVCYRSCLTYPISLSLQVFYMLLLSFVCIYLLMGSCCHVMASRIKMSTCLKMELQIQILRKMCALSILQYRGALIIIPCSSKFIIPCNSTRRI